MRIVKLILICLIISSCSETQKRIELMEKDFDFKMPSCYIKVEDKSFFDVNDFALNLTFELDKDCLELVISELKEKDSLIKFSDKKTVYYYIEINDSEYAELELDKKKSTLRYLFIHH